MFELEATVRCERWERKMARARRKKWSACATAWSATAAAPAAGSRRLDASGNAAFDEYRAETLRRLEDEQREFKDFLDRLRVAKDRAEFDQFMADRRRNRRAPTQPPPAPQQG